MVYNLWIVEKDEIKHFDSLNKLNKFIQAATLLNPRIIVHRLYENVFVMVNRETMEG